MKTETSDLFANATLLETRLGSWPSFHDAEVLRVELSRDDGVVLSMDVYVFASTNEVDSAGYFRRANPSVVTLRFYGLRDLSLQDFNEQNVLQVLTCTRREEGDLLVEISGIYGVSGAFTCSKAEVAAVRATN
jgi:hypothetical protein